MVRDLAGLATRIVHHRTAEGAEKNTSRRSLCVSAVNNSLLFCSGSAARWFRTRGVFFRHSMEAVDERQQKPPADYATFDLSEQDTFRPVQAEHAAHKQGQTHDNAGIDEGLKPARSDPAVKKHESEKRGGDPETEKQDQDEI